MEKEEFFNEMQKKLTIKLSVEEILQLYEFAT